MPCFSIAQVATACASSWTGHTTMIGIFRNMFGSQSCPHIVKYNDFSNFIAYFIQKVCFKALMNLGMESEVCVMKIPIKNWVVQKPVNANPGLI